MEVVQPRCAGLDVSKRDVKVCVRIQGRGSRPTRATVTTWGSRLPEMSAAIIARLETRKMSEATTDSWMQASVRHEALVRREALGVEGGARPPRWAVAAAWWELSAVRPGRRRGGREAALTKPGRSGTARRVGFSERDQRAYERNQW